TVTTTPDASQDGGGADTAGRDAAQDPAPVAPQPPAQPASLPNFGSIQTTKTEQQLVNPALLEQAGNIANQQKTAVQQQGSAEQELAKLQGDSAVAEAKQNQVDSDRHAQFAKQQADKFDAYQKNKQQ